MIGRVQEAKIEFEDRQQEQADYGADDWKERWRDEKANDRSVSEMFESLKGRDS
jgi:hypothetical protein